VKQLFIVGGRRAGKDSIASLLAVYAACIEEAHVGRLRPGERALVQLLAVDRDQSKIILGYIRSYFEETADLRGMIVRETRKGFELDNGVSISITTNSFRQVRGATILLSVFDECAFWKDDTSVKPDVETYRAVLPGLATIPNSMLVCISSPYRRADV
jgi:phage terminase large subunit-like protein